MTSNALLWLAIGIGCGIVAAPAFYDRFGDSLVPVEVIGVLVAPEK
jgi:hypothetical protein